MSPLDDEATGARFERLAPEYQAAFARFLRRHYRAGLQQLHRRLRHASTPLAALAEAPEQSSQAFSQRVCAQRLLDFNAQLGTLLFRHPEQLLPLFHAALAKEVSCNAGQPLEGGGLPSVPLKARRKLKVRVENLPPVPPLRKPAISAIRSNDVKQLIQIAGTVVRTGLIKMQETEREYQCCNARCVPVSRQVGPGAGQRARDPGRCFGWICSHFAAGGGGADGAGVVATGRKCVRRTAPGTRAAAARSRASRRSSCPWAAQTAASCRTTR